MPPRAVGILNLAKELGPHIMTRLPHRALYQKSFRCRPGLAFFRTRENGMPSRVRASARCFPIESRQTFADRSRRTYASAAASAASPTPRAVAGAVPGPRGWSLLLAAIAAETEMPPSRKACDASRQGSSPESAAGSVDILRVARCCTSPESGSWCEQVPCCAMAMAFCAVLCCTSPESGSWRLT
jgi:hypothetical protein